jgi:hypothetical protein
VINPGAQRGWELTPVRHHVPTYPWAGLLELMDDEDVLCIARGWRCISEALLA